ncbi:MAG: DUF3291 domain-containing protein [Pseudomonadota bacterium]
MRAALYTFGLFRVPAEDPANDGFHALNDGVLAEIERARGFIARAGYDDEPEGPPLWGPHILPEFYVERGDYWSPATLSLWEDPQDIARMVRRGLHGEAFKRRREWFVEPAWPPHAIWWVADDHVPDWAEAVARHAHLHAHGPSAHAFNLKSRFPAPEA